jgi:hypothetical protein
LVVDRSWLAALPATGTTPTIEPHLHDQGVPIQIDPFHHAALDAKQPRPYLWTSHAVSSTIPYRFISAGIVFGGGVLSNSDQVVTHPRKVQETQNY